MTNSDELPQVPGVRAASRFFSNFAGEDVVVRPASLETEPFRIEVLLDGGNAVFPPAAPVHEGDVVERADPRGGVIEYSISRYEFSKDPFSHGNDHWNATLVEKGHAARLFAQPSIIVHGGTNQISVGNANHLQQTNVSEKVSEVAQALDEMESSVPRDRLSVDQLEAFDDAVAAAKETISSDAKPTALKRSLYGLRGVVDEIGASAEAGAHDAVKTWVAAATTVVISQLMGF